MKTLVVFDFDDTLFNSGAKIGISKPGKKKRFITSHEYATYDPGEDEEFDYDQFHTYPPDPRPIEQTISALRSAVLRHGLDNVIILTARSKEGPVMQVLQNFGMPPVEIIATGSSNPEAKATAVERLVNDVGYEKVIVYEDSRNNIQAIKDRITPIVGDNFTSFHVKTSTKGATLQRERLCVGLRVTQKALKFFD
jgi:beta-phosphoglucomutase-like phosphatase (HAD superfamily)